MEWREQSLRYNVESNDPAYGSRTAGAFAFWPWRSDVSRSSYLFRTDPGVALWARGVPNLAKDGIAPLDGIIETDWLAFTFTMNWQFTRPGRVDFQKDEPFCFITPIAYRALDDVRPEIVPLADAPDVAAQYDAYSEAQKQLQHRTQEERSGHREARVAKMVHARRKSLRRGT